MSRAANHRITYREHLLDAVKVERGWQAFVDNNEVGTLQPTAQEAIKRGKAFVNRSEGAEPTATAFDGINPNDPDPEWVTELRRKISA